MSDIALSTGHSHHGEEHKTYTSTTTSMGKVFMWLFLCQDALMFMGLFAGYLSVRIGLGDVWPSPNNTAGAEHYPLDINLTAINTFILICSSVTMVMAVQATHFKQRGSALKWLGLTILGGSIFLGVQVYEYYHLILGSNMGMGKSLFDATFFGLTGFHGMHVFSGVMYLIAVAIAMAMGPKSHTKDNGIFEILYKSLSVILTIYFLLFWTDKEILGKGSGILSLWKDGPFLLKAFIVALAAGGSWFLPFIGPAVLLWFVPFVDYPPIPRVALSLVGGSLLYIMWRGVKWLRARNDMPELAEIAGLYWHFVDLIWIILFTLVYLL